MEHCRPNFVHHQTWCQHHTQTIPTKRASSGRLPIVGPQAGGIITWDKKASALITLEPDDVFAPFRAAVVTAADALMVYSACMPPFTCAAV